MLLSSLAAVGFLVVQGPPPLVHRVMALVPMAMQADKPYVPPTPEVLVVPSTPPVAKDLPAPAPSEQSSDTVPLQADTGKPLQKELPAPIAGGDVPAVSQNTEPPSRVAEIAVSGPAEDGKPRRRPLPAPIAGEGAFSGIQLAQAPATNEEILRRLEKLEQENRALKQQLNSGGAAPSTSGGLQPRQAPAQMIGGWRVSLYPWNAESSISGGAMNVFNMPNQRIDATLGQTDQNRPNRVRRPSTDMFVYRLEGWLHVTKGGRHELGFETNCGFDHPCNLVVNLGGVQVLNRRAERIDTKILEAGLDLEPGDYPVEIIFGLSKSKFIKWEPARVSLFPLYRPPGEYNYRTFGPRELLTESNPSIPMGLPRR